MAVEPPETVEVNEKEELLARLASARWQLGRDCRAFGDDLSGKLSVKGQLQRSIQNRPSLWGLGMVVIAFVATRSIFRKKSRANHEKASYEKRRSSLWKTLIGPVLKTLFLAFETQLADVLKEQFSRPGKPSQPHV